MSPKDTTAYIEGERVGESFGLLEAANIAMDRACDCFRHNRDDTARELRELSQFLQLEAEKKHTRA